MNAVVAFALKHRVLMVVLFVMMLAGGIIAFRAAQHRGLSRSHAADGGRDHAEPGTLGRGDRALHHHPDRDADRRRCATSPRSAPFRSTACPDVKLQFTFDYTYERGAAAGAQPAVAAPAAAEQRAAADFAGQPDRRNLSDIGWSGRPATACSISRPCRTGCCSGASARCLASSTSPAGAARPRPSSSRSTSTS